MSGHAPTRRKLLPANLARPGERPEFPMRKVNKSMRVRQSSTRWPRLGRCLHASSSGKAGAAAIGLPLHLPRNGKYLDAEHQHN
jgi:hypothetical protein